MANTVTLLNTQKYLDHTGLVSFWGKIKTYVDNQDTAVRTLVSKLANDNDAAVRAYIETLTVNGVEVTTDAAEGKKGANLSVTIDGDDIAVGSHEGSSNDYAAFKVAAAISDIDDRVEAVEAMVSENIINDLDVVDTDKGDVDYVAASVKFTGEAAKGTRKATITIDETKLADKFTAVDEYLARLEANAGVTNIAIKDVDKDATNLVSVVIEGTKDPIFADGVDAKYKDGARRGDILITVDESALEDRLDANDALVAAEIADRKEDVANLAGSGYTVADGTTAGAWATTVKYQNISAISERLAAIDADLVTKVEEGDSTEYYVTLDVAKGKETGDKAVTLTLNDSALNEKISAMDARDAHNEAELANVSINGKTPITVSGNGKLVGAGVTLTTEDIDRPNGTELEVTLAGYDSKITALSSATHFRGVYDDLNAALAAVKDQGDVVIVGNKEYVYYDDAQDDDFAPGYTPSVGKFVELGDTTQEQAQISALETWVNTNAITTSDIDKLDWTPAITA